MNIVKNEGNKVVNNLSDANNQAPQLCGYADRLQQVKNQLNNYKSSLVATWQDSEVAYISQGIDKAVAQNAYNNACDELAELNKEKDKLVAKLRYRPSLIQKYRDELEKLNKKITDAKLCMKN